jgi:hypothetical protein
MFPVTLIASICICAKFVFQRLQTFVEHSPSIFRHLFYIFTNCLMSLIYKIDVLLRACYVPDSAIGL